MSTLTRSELAAYALCAVVVALIGARALRAPEGPAPASEPVAQAAPRAEGGEDGAGASVSRERGGRAVVHVVGAVHRPGLYTLPDGSRVADAVRRAGGATARAQLSGLNLAAKVVDAQQVVVPRQGEAAAAAAVPGAGDPAGGAAGAPATAPVDVNTATAEQLDALPGIGPATAAKILELRGQRGHLRVDDLAGIPGIGPKRLATLRSQVAG